MTLRELLVLTAATACGFVGGAISSQMSSVSAAAVEPVRASRFELVDDSGRIISTWSRDSEGGASIRFLDRDGHELLSFGLAADRTSPFLNMKGKDGRVRMLLRLNKEERPSLAMGDRAWEGRVILGSIEPDAPSPTDDWGLMFRSPGPFPDLVSLGVHTSAAAAPSGGLTIRNSAGKQWSLPQ